MALISIDELDELPLFYAYLQSIGMSPVAVTGRARVPVPHSGEGKITYVANLAQGGGAICLNLRQLYDRAYGPDFYWKEMCDTGLLPSRNPQVDKSKPASFFVTGGGFDAESEDPLTAFKRVRVKIAEGNDFVEVPDSLLEEHKARVLEREKHRRYLQDMKEKSFPSPD